MAQSSKYAGKGNGGPRQAGQQVKAHPTKEGRSMGDAKTGAGMTTNAGAGARQAPLPGKGAGSDVWEKGNAPRERASGAKAKPGIENPASPGGRSGRFLLFSLCSFRRS
jgi:hypothetical protein